jgi:LmbE family N-acetylglucosaminyl deacetylase
MDRLPAAWLAALACTGCAAVDFETVRVADRGGRGPAVLAVTAHPDDEIAFAGTMYKVATHLEGACDLLVITNGEAGYKYATVAQAIYRVKLTDPEIGRAELPAIRRRELLEAAGILQLRDIYLLGETDNRYTTDPNEVLGPEHDIWNVARVRAALDWVLHRGGYDFVFVHRPTPSTHGHHQAATILALEAVARMPVEDRPVVLAAGGGPFEGEEPPPDELPGFPLTRLRDGVDPFRFDRTQKFGYQERLDYRVITRLAATSHRSQGSYLMYAGGGEQETFRIFALDAPDAVERTQRLFERLREPQFAAVKYDENGELLSVP